MRCPECSKFVSMDTEEPEIDSIDIDEDGTVTATVRIVRNCVECGTTLKEGSIEMTWEPEPEAARLIEDHLETHRSEGNSDPACDGELEVHETNVEAIEEGGGRYKKSYFGATVSFDVTCSGEPGFVVSGEMTDKMAASDMEECA